MAKKDELAVGMPVSIVEGDKTHTGEITRFVPGGKCEIKFPDGDVGCWKYEDVTVVSNEGTDLEAEHVAADAALAAEALVEAKKVLAAEAERNADLELREAVIVEKEAELKKAAEEAAKIGGLADSESVEDDDDDDETITLEMNITIPKSSVTLDSKTISDPILLAKEEVKQKKLEKNRRKNRVAKLTAPPKSPVQVRKGLLEARFRKVKSGKPHNYRKEQLSAWLKEYDLIKKRPNSWKPGCVRAKKIKTAQDFIDELQIDD